MDRTISGVFWLLLYSAIVMVPIALMLVPPVPAGRAFWLELGVALGFVGLTQIALQFVLIARFRRVTAPYGIDVVLHYHRQIAIVAVAAILLHPALIFVADPARLRLLNPLAGNWASRFGLLSIVALVATIVMSLLRERFRLRYEYWRAAHLGLGVIAIVAAQVHVSLAGLYTNTPWKQAIWIGMAAVMVGLVIMLRVLNPIRQRNRAWRVTEVREERGDTWSVALAPVDHDGLRFAPGQFAWVKIADTPFTIEEHPFSFTSSAERRDTLEFGIKELGDFSSRVGRVSVGATAFLDGPHGAFSMDRYQAPGYVFIAGGVGITPFLSMLKTMADRGDPRLVTLIYADRSWDAVAFRDELDALRERVRLDITYVLEDPPEEWEGEEGMVTAEVLERRLPRDGYERMYLLCGPPAMMDGVQSALRERGVPQRHIQLERFALV